LPLQPLRPLQLRHWSHAALHLAEFATHIPADCSDEVERLSCAARELEESGYERRAEECAIRARRLLEAEHVFLPPVLYLPQVDGGVVSISGPSQGGARQLALQQDPGARRLRHQRSSRS